jgi:hypothetical protein
MKLLLCLALLVACDKDGNLCDPDQRYNHGLCYDFDAPPAIAPFGQGCLRDGECTAPATHCHIDLATGAGICTIDGCDATAAICPPTWRCAIDDDGSTVCLP